jgi:hypothetical protein
MNCYLPWNLKDMTSISSEKLQKNIKQQTSYIDLYRTELMKESLRFNIASLLKHVCLNRESFGTDELSKKAIDCLLVFLHATVALKNSYFAPTDVENPAVGKCAKNLHRLMVENVKATMRYIDYSVLLEHAYGRISEDEILDRRIRIHSEVFPEDETIKVCTNEDINDAFFTLVDMETVKAKFFVDFDVQRNAEIDDDLCHCLSLTPRCDERFRGSQYGVIGETKPYLATPFIKYGNNYYSFVTAYALSYIAPVADELYPEQEEEDQYVIEETPVEEITEEEEPIEEEPTEEFPELVAAPMIQPEEPEPEIPEDIQEPEEPEPAIEPAPVSQEPETEEDSETEEEPVEETEEEDSEEDESDDEEVDDETEEEEEDSDEPEFDDEEFEENPDEEEEELEEDEEEQPEEDEFEDTDPNEEDPYELSDDETEAEQDAEDTPEEESEPETEPDTEESIEKIAEEEESEPSFESEEPETPEEEEEDEIPFDEPEDEIPFDEPEMTEATSDEEDDEEFLDEPKAEPQPVPDTPVEPQPVLIPTSAYDPYDDSDDDDYEEVANEESLSSDEDSAYTETDEYAYPDEFEEDNSNSQEAAKEEEEEVYEVAEDQDEGTEKASIPDDPYYDEEPYTALVSPDTYAYLDEAKDTEFSHEQVFQQAEEEDAYEDDVDDIEEPQEPEEPDPYAAESLFSIADDDDDEKTANVVNEPEEQTESIFRGNMEEEEPEQTPEPEPVQEPAVEPAVAPEAEPEPEPEPVVEEEAPAEEAPAEEEPVVEEEPAIEEPVAVEPVEEESEPEPEPEPVKPTTLPLLEQILQYSPSKNNPITQYLNGCSEEQKNDIVKTIEQARKKWIIDGKGKMFTIPDTSISIALFSETQDPMEAIQRAENIGAVMYASQKDSWNSLELSYDTAGQLAKADFKRISRSSFSDWEWKIVEKIGMRLIERRSK